MVPPEEIELNAPTTLPADFGEWDSSEQPAAQPAMNPSGFDGFPGAVVAPKPPAKPATARVAVLPVAPKMPPPAPRRPAPVYAETEHVYQKPQQYAAKATSQEEQPEAKKKTGLFVGIGIVAVLLAGGGFSYLRLRSTTTAQKTTVASQTVSDSSSALKPTPSSPTSTEATTAATTAAAPTVDTTDTGTRSHADSEAMDHQLNAPSRISNDLKTLAGGTGGKDAPPSASFGAADLGSSAAPGVAFGTQSGPKVKVAAPQRVSISAGIAVGLLMQKTAPVYPPMAKTARVQGTVVIQANISKTGSIENPRVVSGPVMLRQSALDAVKTWRFRPYMLSGEPVDVETTINVNFALGG
jgi:TonB family protein